MQGQARFVVWLPSDSYLPALTNMRLFGHFSESRRLPQLGYSGAPFPPVQPLDGARALLGHMKSNTLADDSWSTRRRVIETLVAGIEIETLAFEGRIYGRGRGRTVTLRVSYRFETPNVEELTPSVVVPYSGRLGRTSANVLGLTLTRTHEGVNCTVDQFASARDAAREIVREIVRENPKVMAKEVTTKLLESTGESISQASVSRIKSGMGLKSQRANTRGSHMNTARLFVSRAVVFLKR